LNLSYFILAADASTEMPSKEAQREAAKDLEALPHRQHSRSKSEPHVVDTKLTDDKLAMSNQQMKFKTSSKGGMEPKSQFRSPPSNTFIAAEEQVEGNKTGHQLMSMGDVEREWRDLYEKMTEEEREAKSNKCFNPESGTRSVAIYELAFTDLQLVERARKGVPPAVAIKYLMNIYGSI